MTRLSRHILEQITALSSDGVLVADARKPDLPVLYANPAHERLTGYSLEELAGSGWEVLKQANEDQLEIQRLREAIGRSESCELTLPQVCKDGTSWVARMRVEPLYGARGELKYFLCIQAPASESEQQESALEVGLLQRELRRAKKKIDTLDRIDPATGVLRYSHFLELAKRDFRMARRDDRPLTMMVFEISELDVYRQTFGDKAADSCLRMVAAQITGTLRRAGDICTRCDDTVLAALVHGQENGSVELLAERISSNVRGLGLHNPRATSGRYITVQVGAASVIPGPDGDPEVLLSQARAELASSRLEASKVRA